MAADLSRREVLVLTSLSNGPQHGYALVKDIEDFAGVKLGPGTLYGALARLEAADLIRPLPAQRRRHPYEITAAGAGVLVVMLRSIWSHSAIIFCMSGASCFPWLTS